MDCGHIVSDMWYICTPAQALLYGGERGLWCCTHIILLKQIPRADYQETFSSFLSERSPAPSILVVTSFLSFLPLSETVFGLFWQLNVLLFLFYRFPPDTLNHLFLFAHPLKFRTITYILIHVSIIITAISLLFTLLFFSAFVFSPLNWSHFVSLTSVPQLCTIIVVLCNPNFYLFYLM